ncbi:MAG: hypothetical protein AAF585_12200 [Verrucomicrobiota bacterium]
MARTIFQHLRDEEKDVYKSVLASLAQEKRLRPVFVQRKSVPQQIQWMYDTCKLKVADSVAEHTIQIWLLKAKKDLLTDFLKAMGIEHDEDGTVEDLPEKLDEKKLKSTITKLLKKNNAEELTLYLHMFQLQQPGGWDTLANLIESDDRLYLGEKPAADDSASEEEE